MMKTSNKGLSTFNSSQWVFYLLFVYSYLNVGVLVTRIFRQIVPINIVIFVAAFCFIVLKANYKFFPRYSIWVYVFLLSFIVGGYLGVRADYGYQSIQSIFKHWIVHAGMPWLALICIKKEHYRFYLKTLLVLGGLGGIFSLIQIPFFSFFEPIIGSSTVRTAGFWFNPNNAAMMLLATLFITGSFDSKKNKIVWLLRILIICGIITSFSRTAILLLFIGALYYAVVLRKTKLVIGTFMLGFIFIIGLMANLSQFSEYQQKRIQSVVQIASNEEVEADNRSALWIFATIAVYDNAPIIGLGHASMDHIVPFAGKGLGPHNYFIWIWGNSGIIGVMGLLIYLIAMFVLARKIEDRKIKGGVLILVLTLFCYDILAHDIMAHQMTGIVTSMILISIYFFSFAKSSIEESES